MKTNYYNIERIDSERRDVLERIKEYALRNSRKTKQKSKLYNKIQSRINEMNW